MFGCGKTYGDAEQYTCQHNDAYTLQDGFKRVMLGQDSQKAWYAKRSQPVEHSQEADPGAFFGFSGDVGNQGVGFTVKDAAAQTYAYNGDLKERDAFEEYQSFQSR